MWVGIHVATQVESIEGRIWSNPSGRSGTVVGIAPVRSVSHRRNIGWLSVQVTYKNARIARCIVELLHVFVNMGIFCPHIGVQRAVGYHYEDVLVIFGKHPAAASAIVVSIAIGIVLAHGAGSIGQPEVVPVAERPVFLISQSLGLVPAAVLRIGAEEADVVRISQLCRQVRLDIAAAFLQAEYVAVVFPYGAHHAVFAVVPGLPVRVVGQAADTDVESTYTGNRGICPSVGDVSEGHVTNRTCRHTVQIVHG